MLGRTRDLCTNGAWLTELVEEQHRAEEKEKTAKEASRRKRVHWKKRPTKKKRVEEL